MHPAREPIGRAAAAESRIEATIMSLRAAERELELLHRQMVEYRRRVQELEAEIDNILSRSDER